MTRGEQKVEVYLDYAATSPVYEEVMEIVEKTMKIDYGNPSAMHKKGLEAESYIKETNKVLASILKVQEKELFYTSGGTESNNWALHGSLLANHRRGKHIITTAIEHPAVLSPMKYWEEEGYEVTYLSVDKTGCISLEELKASLRQDTILVSIMFVNNELGSIQPIKEAGELIHSINPHTLFHVDAIQAFGKYRILPKKMQIDLLSISGHKIHGPKGIGLLYVNSKIKFHPLILGGGQQKNMRSGTENVPGIAGFGIAAKLSYDNIEEKMAKLRMLRNDFVDNLQKIEDVRIHGMDRDRTAPHIVNVAFLGVRSEVLLHALEERGVYISAGSACSSHKRGMSPSLAGIGLLAEEAESSVRFSFAEETSKEELDYTISVLKEVIPMLRRFKRH